MIRNYKKSILLIFFSLLLLSKGHAANTANTTVTYTVGSIDSISVSANPGALNITTAVAGSAPPSAVDATTTYAVTTNNTARRVTGSLATAMPAGVTLSVALTAPSGGTSAGAVTLTTTSNALVTGIAHVASSGLSVTYTLTATLSAAQVAAATNTLTYTIGP